MYADLLIYNGKCLSIQDNLCYDWIAVQKEKIIRMGYGDTYKSELDGFDIDIDANGCSVLPGFYDSNFHFVQTALDQESIYLGNAKSFGEIGALIRAEARKKSDAPIVGYGLDETKLEEERLPDRYVLDSFCSDRPVWLSRVEYHTSVLNTYALLRYKIPYTIQGIELDGKKMPTGIFRLYANAMLREEILSEFSFQHRLEAAKKLVSYLLSKGVTTVNAMEGGFLFSDKDAEFVHMYAEALPIELKLFFQTTDVRKILDMGLKRMGGSLFADGAFGSRNAALSDDYSDMPGVRGTLYYSQDEMNELVLSCYENGIQLAVHAIGERAIDQMLTAHNYAMSRTNVTGLRHRLEHVELATPSHIAQAAQLGLIFSMQPAYEYYWGGKGGMYEKRLGERYRRTNPFREIGEAGIVICGGSDSDVTPADPLLGIHEAVNHPVKEHRTDVFSAIKMFTANGAYAVSEEHCKGDLRENFLADMVVLDKDIFSVPVHTIKDCRVVCTVKSGNLLYRCGNFPGQ
jgi:predicted amidohydrolase YtcJ